MSKIRRGEKQIKRQKENGKGKKSAMVKVNNLPKNTAGLGIHLKTYLVSLSICW